jgi:hypothetical protein
MPFSIWCISHHTTAEKQLSIKRYNDQHFHFVCRVEGGTSTAKHRQCWCTTAQQGMQILIPTQTHHHICTHTLDNSSISHRTTCHQHWCIKWNDDQHFHLVCQTAVHIAMDKSLQSRYRHRQRNSWLGLRGCKWELTTLQLVRMVHSIQFFHVILITQQQDCVSPSGESLPVSQDSWSQQHNLVLSWGTRLWLATSTDECLGGAPSIAFGMTSGHSTVCLLSSVWFLSVFSMA